MKKKAQTPPPSFQRRDATGHLNEKYAFDLLAEVRTRASQPDERVFLGAARSDDDLAEQLGETFVRRATSGEDAAHEIHEEVVEEETGGPFIEASAKTEFAPGFDGSNPPEAEREPFPTT